MRTLYLTSAFAFASAAACNSSGTATPPDGGAADAPAESIAPSDAEAQPDAQSCSGSNSACLFGTAEAAPGDAGGAAFPVTPTRFRARLFRQFPTSGVNAIAEQLVAKDHTWAFSGLDPWAHYYVQFEPGFPTGEEVTKTVATRIGPLAVPGDGVGIDVQVKPVQLDVFEAISASAPRQLESAIARLMEETEGGSSVSLLVGTSEKSMTYDSKTLQAYAVTFAMPMPAAQTTYQITTSSRAGPTATWNLVSYPPTFTGAINQPPTGATIPAGQPLMVTWSPQAADYVRVDLYEKIQGSWVSVYTSSSPRPSDVTSEAIPAPSTLAQDAGVMAAGSYLLNVSFTKANCSASADGCVHSSTVADEVLTVQ